MLENKLNELNIFALRDLARKTGVNSPTSKKKEELIKEIVEIRTGVKVPEKLTKQGRPPKVFDYDFENVFTNRNLEEVNVNSFQTLNQGVEEYQHDDLVTVAGCLELVNNNAGILWVEKNLKNENYFIPSALLQKFNVRNGDRVVAEVSIDNSQKIVKEIFSINDCPILKLPKKRNEYDLISNVIPNQTIKFKSKDLNLLEVKVGENIYVYGTNNNENTKCVIDLLNNAEVENKLYVNVSVAGKNEFYIKEINNAEKFVANILDSADVAKRVVMLAVERVKRILETGENVLIVVDDMASVLGVDKFGDFLMRSLVSVTKATKGKGSITLVSVMPHENFNQIEKLADCRLKIEGNKIFKIN